MFQGKISPPFSLLKNKPGKKSARSMFEPKRLLIEFLRFVFNEVRNHINVRLKRPLPRIAPHSSIRGLF
jgi:hypothetical protein